MSLYQGYDFPPWHRASQEYKRLHTATGKRVRLASRGKVHHVSTNPYWKTTVCQRDILDAYCDHYDDRSDEELEEDEDLREDWIDVMTTDDPVTCKRCQEFVVTP